MMELLSRLLKTFKYLGSRIIDSEKDLKGQVWLAATRMKAIWKSHLPTELKTELFFFCSGCINQPYYTDVKHGVEQMRLTRNLMVLTLNYFDMLLIFNGQNTWPMLNSRYQTDWDWEWEEWDSQDIGF
jgi:hypothetical protein